MRRRGTLRNPSKLADACAAPFERALTLLALADLRIAQRRPDDAAALLDDIRAICAPLAAKPTLERVAVLEEKICGKSLEPTGSELPAGLTQREVEVLRHIAAGESNRQIANALFLSPRTVERHIANIYLKIEVHSKAEATAFALRNHLA